MKIKQAAAAFAALTMLAGAPAIVRAAANDSGDPIAVNDVQFVHWDNDLGSAPGKIDFSFENTSNAAVTDVLFVVDAAGSQVDRFDDQGSFAPGVTIRPSFPTWAQAPSVEVKVAQVTFADGSVWVPDASRGQ